MKATLLLLPVTRKGARLTLPPKPTVEPVVDSGVVELRARPWPVEIACPVAVAVKRRKAAEQLIEHYDCDLILCDDGLQHYSLARDLEIAVIDGEVEWAFHRS